MKTIPTTPSYNNAFWNAMRGQQNAYAEMTEGADGSGAYIIPDEFVGNFNTALEKENLFRRLGTVISMSSPGGKIQSVTSTGEAMWTGEGAAIPESTDRFSQLTLESHKLAAMTRLKESFIKDYAFNVEQYLQNELARRFGKAEEAACIAGDGIRQPYGILDHEHGAEVGLVAAVADTVTFDEVNGLFFSLNSEYRRDAVWLMNDETAFHLRTLKDAAGRYLWRDSDDTILGRSVVASPYMPGMTADAKAIAFGDLSIGL